MQKLRFLKIVFDLPLHQQNIPAFRAAIAEKVGFEHDRYHNHRPDGSSIYRYPLIQYKSPFGKGTIICMHEAIEDIYELFDNKTWDITMLGKPYTLKVDILDLKEFDLRVLETPATYRIHNWIALNQKNYPIFNSTLSVVKRYQMLEQTLASNILAFAQGVGWHIDDYIDVILTEAPRSFATNFKGRTLKTFSATFQTNVLLPYSIGLGKGTSRGYGIVSGERRAVVKKTQ